MREILFHGKRKDNGEWVEGYYAFIGWTKRQKHYIIPDYASDFYGFEVDPENVCQFTGMIDKNKKRIFEGDICRVNLGNKILNGFVEYDERCGSWRIIFEDTDCILFLDLWFKRDCPGIWCEVIGNRFDNPELLKDGEHHED